jgi:hypothetical protein
MTDEVTAIYPPQCHVIATPSKFSAKPSPCLVSWKPVCIAACTRDAAWSSRLQVRFSMPLVPAVDADLAAAIESQQFEFNFVVRHTRSPHACRRRSGQCR